VSVKEAVTIVSLSNLQSAAEAFMDTCDYIESMLRKQLSAAIGKELQPKDFEEYMEYHYRKVFNQAYAPVDFCYAIRRPGCFPEGELSLEQSTGESNKPVVTTSRRATASVPMKFSLNAATKVSFLGDRILHALVLTQFQNQASARLSLIARARQFSSFILMVGTISSADTFAPAHAIIIKNKDDLKIPLLLETIPTPKEFKDAISSMSPEQQRFCKAYRSLQLASTLFGMCVIQIKPALEKVLNLPSGSLTKEIALTESLMELFIDFQLPPDMVSFDGPESDSAATKLEQVKLHVGKMEELIAKTKEKELVGLTPHIHPLF